MTEAERSMLEYAEKLTLTPAMMTQEDVQKLRDAGWTDRDVLDIATVCAYFNFRVRLVDGLGLELSDQTAESATLARSHAATLAEEKGVALPTDIWDITGQAKTALTGRPPRSFGPWPATSNTLYPGRSRLRLSLSIHPVTEMEFGASTRLQDTVLQINESELRQHILEDHRLESVDLAVVVPGDPCRVGYVFDIVEPRAKEPGAGTDFPGILGPAAIAGEGITHVLRGAAVTVVDGGQPGGDLGYISRRGGMTKVLEMSGPPAQASSYGSLQHLVVVPHPLPNVERHSALNALRIASLKASVYLARAGQAASNQAPAETQVFELESSGASGRNGLHRVAYIGQVHGHQHGTELDEHILYGSNTRGMMPAPLHPNEWLDGAVVISYSWGARGLETYYYQNHPVIGELYRLHQAGELNFVGTIATTPSDVEADLSRNCMVAAKLAKWDLKANGVILTKYAGGAPHTDMFETARQCEALGIKTAILVSDTASDRRAESAALMSVPGVDAVVSLSEGADISWQVPAAQRVIAGNAEVAEILAPPQELSSGVVCGVTNNQGASRLRPMVY